MAESDAGFDVVQDDLKARTVQGGVARMLAQATTFVLRLGSMMLLARILEPRDFGLVNMVTVVTGLFSLFKDAGLSLVTVQRATISDAEVSSLFWLNVLVGGIFTTLSIAAAPLLVEVYDEPRLYWIAVIMGTGFLFNALGVQHSALLQRRMRFAVLATVEVVALLVSVLVATSMALAGYGYWALVGMGVSLPIASSAGAWVCAGWVPGLPRRGVGVMSMLRTGGIVSLNGLVVYFAYNVDKFLLGRVAGAETLGIYGRAYQLVNIPSDILQGAVGGVALSALSRVQIDVTRLRRYFLKGYSLFLAMTMPVTVACGLFANDIVYVLLGPKWAGAAPLFRLLAPTILALALINPFGWLLFATGRIERSLRMAFVIAPSVITAYALGLSFGPAGVAFAFSAAMMALTIPMILWAIKDSPIRPADVIGTVWAPAASAIVAAVLVSPIAFGLAPIGAPLPRLTASTTVFFGSYLLMLMYPMGQKHILMALGREVLQRR